MTGFTIWLTGRSGSGKTTLGTKIINYLQHKGHPVQLLDGDIVRGVVKNQDFSREGRHRHLTYMGLTAKLLNDQNIITVCTFVSPYEETREILRTMIPNFYLIHIKCSLEEAKSRDVKGLYSKKIPGIEVFETPVKYDLEVDTELLTIVDSFIKIKNVDWLNYESINR